MDMLLAVIGIGLAAILGIWLINLSIGLLTIIVAAIVTFLEK